MDEEIRQALEEANNAQSINATNRLVGCLFLLGGGLISAIVLVGYWATH